MSEPKGRSAEDYYESAAAAMEAGGLTEAIVSLEQACRLEPDNPVYREKLAEARQRATQVADDARVDDEGLPQSLSPARRLGGRVAFGLVCVGLVGSIFYATRAAPRPQNHAETYAKVAPFQTLYRAEDGSWHGILGEDWADASGEARQGRCDAVAAALPSEGFGMVSLQSRDGYAVSCFAGRSMPQ